MVMVSRNRIGIGLMGLGVIGGGVARALLGKADILARQSGCPLVLKRVLEIDSAKHGSMGIEHDLFTTQFKEIVGDPGIDIVIELIGGEHPAFEYIKECLVNGKHVVTANKEVMAKHGQELIALAQENHISLRYEASVGGGIPLIAPFQRDLVANDIIAIYAIVNGTTNYILTQMAHKGLDFAVALKQAQELGYADSNPANDIEGLDAAYKLAVLATLAFNTEVSLCDIYYEGIARLQARDFRYARELGYTIKLLAIAKQAEDSIEARVHPVFIPEDFLLAKVDGVYNAIQVEGDLVGKVIFYGEGAGPSATSSAIIADVMNIAKDINRDISKAPVLFLGNKQHIKPMDEIESRYYLRMRVIDEAGVLARISKILGDHSISISSVIQKEIDLSTHTAEIVIMTHPAKEQAFRHALKEAEQLTVVKDISNFVRVEV